jgi:hypothetical protein
MNRQRKKRNGSPQGHTNHRTRLHRDKNGMRVIECWNAYDKYSTPRKFRRGENDITLGCLRVALRELVEEYPHYLTFEFWEDLQQKGIRVPIIVIFLLPPLRRNPSEVLRMIADYIDAYGARKGDRGARLQATEKLYEYACDVLENGAKELNWRELKQKFCTYYEDDKNWQKFLRVRGIPFKKVGIFRPDSVRKGKKNTLGRVCGRLRSDHQSRRDRNNAENGSRPRR